MIFNCNWRTRIGRLAFVVVLASYALSNSSIAAPRAAAPSASDTHQQRADEEFQAALVALDAWCEAISSAARTHADSLALMLRLEQCDRMHGQVESAQRRLATATARAGADVVAQAQAQLDSEIGGAVTADPLLAEIDPLLSKACGHFMRSLEIDPAAGAQLASAFCRLREGKLRSAREMVAAARKLLALPTAQDVIREQQIALAQWLELEIERVKPRVTLRAYSGFQGEVRISSEALRPNGSLAVDPGQHVVTSNSPHSLAREQVLSAAPTQRLEIRVEEPRRSLGTGRKIAVWGGLGLGVTSAGLAGAMYWNAQRHWDILARDGCTRSSSFGGGSTCLNPVSTDRTESYNFALGVFQVAGAAALVLAATSAVSYFTAPRAETLRIMPVVAGDRAGGAALIGTF